MAITINSQPSSNELLTPYRPLEIRVTSDNTDSDGTPTVYTVKVKCFIYLDGSVVSDNADNPIILDPDIGTSYTFTFDISSYLSGLDTLTNTIQTKGSAISVVDSSANSIKSVRVRFTEVLLQTDGTLTNGATSSYTNTFYIINGVWQHDQISDKFDSFEIASSGDKYFLTNYRTNTLQRKYRTIGVNDSEYVSGFTNLTVVPYYRLILYTGKYAQGTATNYYQPLSAFSTKRFDLPVGVANIHATTGGWLNISGVSVADPVIDSSVGSYSVAFTTGTNNTKTSEVVHFNVDHTFCEDESTRIKFLNRLGAFEYFTFKGYRDRSTIVRNQYYNRALDASYSVHEGGDRVLASDVRTEFTVYSQALTEAQRIWLEEMLDGHECFVEEGNNYIPIKIRAGKTQIIQEASELFTIKMTYQYANPTRRQHGGY